MSTGTIQPFQPIATFSVRANATTAQTATVIAGDSVLVLNDSADIAFIKIGGIGTVAQSTDTPVPAGQRQLFAIGPYATTVSALSNSVNTGMIFFTVGSGTAY